VSADGTVLAVADAEPVSGRLVMNAITLGQGRLEAAEDIPP